MIYKAGEYFFRDGEPSPVQPRTRRTPSSCLWKSFRMTGQADSHST